MIKHFIDIDNFSLRELDLILSTAKKLKKNNTRYEKLFNNKSLGLLFQKESTRTRLSFSIGMQKLGGSVIELDLKAIGFGKRESEEDILKTLSCYIDCLMIRNNNHKKIQYYASLNVLPIINGLSDYSHPCQILSDIFTLKEKLGKLSNKTVCWIGDFNNVLRSLIQAQHLYSFQLNIVMPKQILGKNKLNINKIKLDNRNDDKILKKDLVNEIYRFPEKKVAVINDITLERNFLVYIDKIDNVNINKKPEEYKKHLNLSKIKISNNLFNSYDSYIKKKYNIDINYKSLDIVKNYFN